MTFHRRSRLRFLLAFVLALTASCDGIPMDPEDTLERVRSSRPFRVGQVAGSDRSNRLMARFCGWDPNSK